MARALTQQQCDRAKLLSSVHPERTVVDIIGISRATLWALKRRDWKSVGTTKRFRPRPSDFAIQLRRANRHELAVHYRTSHTIIARWARELRTAERECGWRR